MVKYLKGDFKEEINGKKVLVDFYADWCGPCKMMSSILENVTQIDVLKVNVDQFSHIAQMYNVMSIPTLILFENGKPLKARVGVMNIYELNDFIQ